MTDDPFANLSEAELRDLVEGMSAGQLKAAIDARLKIVEYEKFHKLEAFKPYPKQLEHFALGRKKEERMLTAGNRQGKTEAGAAEMAYHLTGLYPERCERFPEGWPGRRWVRPVRAWACGDTSLNCRDIIQRKLCGEPGVTEQFGSGMIPKHLIVDTSLARGVTDAFDTVQVRHVSGGISIVRFKSYEQGRAKFQGEDMDFIWDDEEPPADVYEEQTARIIATRGMIAVTFTSMLGRTAITDRFTEVVDPARALTRMGLKDALHIKPEEYQGLLNKFPKHTHVARIDGGIMRGVGRVFSMGREAISEAPIQFVPEHWHKGWGIDFGIAHPFGAVLVAHDRDADCVHVLRTIRVSEQLPLQHAVPMKSVGADVPVAWPHDGNARDKGSGEPLSKLYKAQGLRMLPTHATFPDGSNSTEAGVLEMDQRMQTGRLKVAANLSDWFEEFDDYHRKEDTQIVKTRDDLMSATRMAIMSLRFFKPVMLGPRRPDQSGGQGSGGLARGVEFELF